MPLLQSSLISSFSLNGNTEVSEAWPSSIRFVEIYAFMQSDALTLFGPASEGTALSVMSSAFDNSAEIDRVSQKVTSMYAGKQIVAFATYLPEILSHRWNPIGYMAAQRALEFVIRVAQRLHKYGHPVKVVELVGGSKIDGVWAGQEVGRKVYIANRITDVEAITRLLERLEGIAAIACQEPRISLGLELEPGPLFTVNAGNIKLLCDLIDQGSAAIRGSLGLNLDIPHWDFLGNLGVEWLRAPANANVLQRIVHAHICDHTVGHFGDSALYTFHHVDRFQEWVNLLVSIADVDRDTTVPAFSGFISLELECCKFCESLEVAAKHLINLVGKANRDAGKVTE